MEVEVNRSTPRVTPRRLAEIGLWLGMTVEAIKDAIVHLSESETKQLADWLEELQEEAWDRQMERDFAHGGRGAQLLEAIDRQIDAGNFTSLDRGLRRLSRKKRAKGHLGPQMNADEHK